MKMHDNVMDIKLKDFYREYCDDCFDDEEGALEIFEFEEKYTDDHPAFASIISASTSADRRRAWNAVQLEKARAAVMHGWFADCIEFFDVKCMNDIKSTDIKATLKQMATDEKLPDERRRQAIRLWNRAQRASLEREAELILNYSSGLKLH